MNITVCKALFFFFPFQEMVVCVLWMSEGRQRSWSVSGDLQRDEAFSGEDVILH